ncbi:MAG: hypothetical protein ACK500_08805 [Flavobacteriales bacterium]
MNIRPFIVASCAVILMHFSVSAQQDNGEPQTLFGNGRPFQKDHIGFFLAPTAGMTAIDGSGAALFNLRGGLSFADRFSLGAYYSVSLNQIRPQSETLTGIYMDYWSVGGFAEYTVFSDKLVHLTFPVFAGYGEVEMDNEEDEAGLGEANFFQIEPAAMVEVNLTKHVRFNIGTGYRIISPMTYRNFDQNDASGLTGYAGLKIGLFR